MIEAERYTVVPDDVKTNVPVSIGAFTSIASGLTIVSGDHPTVDNPKAVSNFPFNEWENWGEYSPSTEKGKVLIGSDVWIGQDVTIMDGIWIGHGAIIGAGSLVASDVHDYDVVAGNPARVLFSRYTLSQINKLLKICWWDWPDEKIAEYLPYMKDIDTFLAKVQLEENAIHT